MPLTPFCLDRLLPPICISKFHIPIWRIRFSLENHGTADAFPSFASGGADIEMMRYRIQDGIYGFTVKLKDLTFWDALIAVEIISDF